MNIKSLFTTLFGRFSWQGPEWLNRSCSRCPRAFGKFFSLLLLGLIILVSGFYVYKQFHKAPNPNLIVARITIPPITKNDHELIPEPLVIDFGTENNGFQTQAVAPIKLINNEVKEGISLTPALPGTWRWDTDSHLIFMPAKDWPAGQKYKIHFAKHFFANPKKIQKFDYEFTTLPFQLNIAEFKFYQDPLDPQLRQAIATVNFNYPVDTKNFEQHLFVQEQQLKSFFNANGKPFNFTVTYDEHKRTAFVHSENIPITQNERYLELLIKKGVKPLIGPSETPDDIKQSLLIPDTSSYFKIQKTSTGIVRNDKDNPEQVLFLETSIGVKASQLNKAIHVYLLPQDYPASAAEAAKTNYEWKNPGEVTSAILALSTPVNLDAIPTEQENATLHSYRFNAATPSYIYIKIDKGVTGFGNFSLSQDYTAVVPTPAYPQEITFLHKGALLALSSEKKLSVTVRGLPAVKFRIARVLPSDVNQLITQTEGDFNNPKFINPSFNQDNISEIFSEIQTFTNSDYTKAQYTAIDLGKYLAAQANTHGPQGLFLLQAEGWDPETQAPMDIKSSRLVLITDMGLLVKDNNDGSHDVFVQSIAQGVPVANVNISVLGKNGLPILSRITDVNGRANIPSLKDFEDEKEPTVYIAQHGNDISFIPFSQFDRQLNLSKFDVGGVYTDQEAKSLTAYVFSDRGIYRPGDTAHIGMIVKQAYAAAQPAGLPLEVTVMDPRGTVVKDQKFTLDASGYLSLDFTTSDNSPTGQYSVNLYIVKDGRASSLLGSADIRVAEFLPDNMRITTHLSQTTPEGWVLPTHLSANVSLWNLYGAPATDRKINAKILLTPQPVKFRNFPQYIFTDPLLDPKKPPKVFTDTLGDQRTNNEGQANFDLKLDRFDRATYELTFFAEGFEADGGRSVAAKTSVLVSPLTFLIGYKPDGDLSYIQQNSIRQVNFIAVNPQLQKHNADNLKLQLMSLQPVSTLIKKSDGTYQYQSIIQSTLIKTDNFNIPSAGSNFSLPTNRIGDFAVAIIDTNNIELTRFKYTVVGASQLPLPKNAELTVKLNKGEYLPNEDIEMQVTAPYTGTGLITVERDKVYAAQWFKADTTSSMQKIHLPHDFQSDGYVNIAFVRDWNSPEIFVSPLSYNVTPFVVNHANHDIKINLTAPEKVRPGDALTITYQMDKPGKIIIFAVDEGILQAAGYNTPDPLGFFFQKHALEVNTQQTLDQILPKFIQERELSAVGGDGGEAAALKTLNPFKRKTDLPVVYWSGIIDADSQLRSLTYQVPDYFNGALRIMAVAVAENAVGAGAKNTEVKGDFIITPNAPTFVAPGDEFEMTASIANNLANSGTNAAVKVTLSVSPQLEVIQGNQQTLTIAEGQEKSAHFRLRAKSVLGSAVVTLSAGLDGKSATRALSMSVRPLNPYYTAITSGYSRRGTEKLNLDRELYPEYRVVDAAISANPLILIMGLNRYLENFPYGCTEQLTSKAMPLFALAEQSGLSTDTSKLTNKIQQTIQVLAQRQMSSGGFSYWPSVDMNESNAFASVYALHFLTVAKAHDYIVPNDMFNMGLTYLRELAGQTPTNMDEARNQAYAIYILTRNEIVTTNYLTNLQGYLDKDPKAAWKQDILSAYIAATYQLLKSFPEANKLITYYKPQSDSLASSSDFYDRKIANAQYLYLLAEHFPDQLPKMGDNLVLLLVKALNSSEMNTVLSGYSSLAFEAYAHAAATQSSGGLSITGKLKNGTENVLTSTDSVYQQVAIDDVTKQVLFKGNDKLGYFYQLSQSGYDKALPQTVIKNGIEVYREYRDLEGKVIDEANLGSEVVVHIQIRSLNEDYLTNIAIVDLLPGGFDVIRDSVKLHNVDYADVREDRVIFFTSVNSEAKEIVYHIKATSAGKYSVPGILAQSMYDPGIVGRGVGGIINISNP